MDELDSGRPTWFVNSAAFDPPPALWKRAVNLVRGWRYVSGSLYVPIRQWWLCEPVR